MGIFKSNFLTRTLLLLFIASAIFTSCKKDSNNNDNSSTSNVVLSGFITGTRTLSADTIYELAGYVVVDSLATLNIDPGTIIKARQGSGAAATALIVSRYGTINAVGTAAKPIVFTSILDNITVGEKFGTNLGKENAGLWGGVILLGQANVSTSGGDTEGQIEGIPADYTFGRYGGTNNTQSSGTLSYVSIRHNGTELKPDEELQGLTLGGVGSGTTISNVEVVASSDDGIEIFGGTVNLSNIVIIYHQDDGLDLDQNYDGTIDNAYIIHEGAGAGNAGFEFDGPENSTYTSGTFTVQNVTCKTLNGASGRAITLKSDAQGTISNCSFSGYTNWVSVQGGGATGHYAGGTLEITGSQFESSADISTLVEVTGATPSDSTTIVSDFSSNNTAVSTVTVGANTSGFGWTWGSNAGLL